ncbi:hypothetical protein BpHYR1_005383 [Brachionus plicatilis]|uniref:Uncharacterized protein n=1 Tax=Brachionus plicatilis TaxID=10195 RepID=A0A3M7RGY2_BRAPC|nr:hypothetical protein BpHYR1_005383 [Brachionus plicatilis]
MAICSITYFFIRFNQLINFLISKDNISFLSKVSDLRPRNNAKQIKHIKFISFIIIINQYTTSQWLAEQVISYSGWLSFVNVRLWLSSPVAVLYLSWSTLNCLTSH